MSRRKSHSRKKMNLTSRVTDEHLSETFRNVTDVNGLTSHQIQGYLRAEHGHLGNITDKDVKIAIHRALKDNKIIPNKRGRFLWWSKDAGCDKAKSPPEKSPCQAEIEDDTCGKKKRRKPKKKEEDSSCEQETCEEKEEEACKPKKRKPRKRSTSCSRKKKRKPRKSSCRSKKRKPRKPRSCSRRRR